MAGVSGPWTELLQTYDPGWRLQGQAPTAVADGLFGLYHPALINANPAEGTGLPQGWQPADPIEIGTISITGNQLTQVPEVNQQNGSPPTVYTFELFHGLLTWHQLSGNGWDTTHPWRQLS